MDNRIKEKELIAIGAAVKANCQPCLEYHISKAQESGADEQNISKAIAVAKMLRKGAMAKMDEFTSRAAADTEVKADASEKGGGCCS